MQRHIEGLQRCEGLGPPQAAVCVGHVGLVVIHAEHSSNAEHLLLGEEAERYGDSDQGSGYGG